MAQYCPNCNCLVVDIPSGDGATAVFTGATDAVFRSTGTGRGRKNPQRTMACRCGSHKNKGYEAFRSFDERRVSTKAARPLQSASNVTTPAELWKRFPVLFVLATLGAFVLGWTVFFWFVDAYTWLWLKGNFAFALICIAVFVSCVYGRRRFGRVRWQEVVNA